MKLRDIARGGAGDSTASVIILTADRFEDLEVLVPYFRLLESGIGVDIAAPSMDDITGKHGYSVAPGLRIDDVDPASYDLLIVPGGPADGAPAAVRDSPHARAVAKSFVEADKPVAAICHGPWLLAAADVIRGRHLTSYWHDGVPRDVRAAGGIWEDSPVVVDGRLVTSRSPADLVVFTSALIHALAARRQAARLSPG